MTVNAPALTQIYILPGSALADWFSHDLCTSSRSSCNRCCLSAGAKASPLLRKRRAKLRSCPPSTAAFVVLLSSPSMASSRRRGLVNSCSSPGRASSSNPPYTCKTAAIVS